MLYKVDGYDGIYCYKHAKELEESLSKGKIMNKVLLIERINELKTEEHLAQRKQQLAETEMYIKEDGD